MDIKKLIKEAAESYYEELVGIRRHLHKYPELSFKEFKTSDFIAEKLKEAGIKHTRGFVKTGILGEIDGAGEGPVVGIRADMDALPISEENEIDFKSQNEGVMHACGHDVHTTCLLGAAKVLNDLRKYFHGKVLLIFQPGEELLPGGAKLMMDEGLFDQIKPDLIIAQHVLPTLEAGKTGFRPGMYMASTDEIYLTVKGNGGHAAMPHNLVDHVLIASHIIVALQQVVSRNGNVAVPSVLSFGKVTANGATNVIPPKVDIAGTFRTMDEAWRATAHEKIKKIAAGIAEGMGGSCDVNIAKGYPVLFNDEEVTHKAKDFAIDLHGADQVIDLDIRMTAEDFAYFSQQYPATMYRLGVAGDFPQAQLHNPHFMVDEKALKTGVETLSWLAYKFLTQ